MADVITTENYISIDTSFIDGDTRNIKIKNPNSEITTEQIQNLETLILNGGTSTLLIGDKAGSPFRRIEKVTKVSKQTVTLDKG